MENWEKICRFCFEKCYTNFKAIEKSTHEILNVLLVTVDLAISDDPVMCTNCSDILQNCFVFKKTCLDTRDHTVALGKDKNNGHAICEFCMNHFKSCSFTILNIEGSISEKTMLERYLPELDLNASKKPVICEVCHGYLVNYFRFITTTSIVEGKIKAYFEAEGINNTIPIKLSVLQFPSENVREENDHKLDIYKMTEMKPKSEDEKIMIREGICTLCLGKCENFKAIDGKARNILDRLLPKIDFTVMEGPVMCKNCEEMLMKCFDFRSMCLHTQNCIVSIHNNEDDVKVDIKDVYLSKNVTGTGAPEDQNVCGFCMGLIKNCSAVFLEVEEGDVVLEKMIEQCLPELDLSVIRKPVICAACHGTLEDCFNFVMNCLIMGENAEKYCETPDIDSKGQIELSSSLSNTRRDVATGEVDGKSSDIIKVEEQFCEDRRNPDASEIGNEGDIVKLEQLFDDIEDPFKSVENKNNSYMETNGEEVNNEQQFTSRNMLACAGENGKLGFIKTEEISSEEDETKHKEETLEMEDQQFLLKEEIEIKTEEHDFNRFEDNIFLPQSEVIARLYRRKKRSAPNLERDRSNPPINHILPRKHITKTRMYQRELLHKNFKKHLPAHNNISDINIYNCDSCSFQAKRKINFLRHLMTHKDPSEITMYKCDSCLYQTRHKNNLKQHSLKHKDPSEVTMYKCDSCLYQTKRKYDLKKHLLKYKDPSGAAMYKCVSVSFQAEHNAHLKSHLSAYKDPSGVKMYKCDSCLYQAKRKDDLKKHLLKHKDPSEVTMYRCDSCSYETKRKPDLKKHLLLHKDPSEVTIYKCISCSFQTKRKDNLQKHLLQHKDPSELTMYKCDLCLYQTKHKYCLNNHLLRHKDPSEVTMYKCDTCPFQTKYKVDLKQHSLKHKDPSEVATYKCDSCLYQTKRKNDLKNHMLKHKDVSKVTMYKCDSCSFQTIHKASLRSHLLKHKNPSEATVYKCDSCSFETKTKYYLKKHLILHKDSQ